MAIRPVLRAGFVGAEKSSTLAKTLRLDAQGVVKFIIGTVRKEFALQEVDEMAATTLPDNIARILDILPGESREDKLMNLVLENISSKLKECEIQMAEFEAKYGMSFEEFEHAWKEGSLGNPYSYSLEKDYMEWEGFYSEKRKWLSILKELRNSLEAER